MRFGQSTGGAAPDPPFDPQSVIHFDTRRHSGVGDPLLVNYGSAGAVFDLDALQYNVSGDTWGIKRYNWYSQGTTGSNGLFPSTWADLGGNPTTAPFFYAVYHPPSFSGQNSMYTEMEWYINYENPGDISFACGDYIDFFDGTLVPGGFTSLYWGPNFEQYCEFYPEYFGPFGGNRRSTYANCLIAHYADPNAREQGLFIYDGFEMYSFRYTAVSSGYIEEDAVSNWIYMEDNLDSGYDETEVGNAARVFWSFGYHEVDHYGPLPGYGESWGMATGAVLTRPTTDQQDDLEAYVRGWHRYFSSSLDDIDMLNPDL